MTAIRRQGSDGPENDSTRNATMLLVTTTRNGYSGPSTRGQRLRGLLPRRPAVVAEVSA